MISDQKKLIKATEALAERVPPTVTYEFVKVLYKPFKHHEDVKESHIIFKRKHIVLKILNKENIKSSL